MCAHAPVAARLLSESAVSLAEHGNASIAPEFSLLSSHQWTGGGEELRVGSSLSVGMWV